jgi:hypothetical protein
MFKNLINSAFNDDLNDEKANLNKLRLDSKNIPKNINFCETDGYRLIEYLSLKRSLNNEYTLSDEDLNYYLLKNDVNLYNLKKGDDDISDN